MKTPPLLTVDDYRRESAARLPKLAHDYYESGSEEQFTLKRNEAAFSKLLIRPRCFRSVADVDPSVVWFRKRQNFPIGIAPTAFHRMATDDGELDTVRGAAKANAVMICSSWGTTPIERIAEEAHKMGAELWFQLYVYRDRGATEALIRRAEAAKATVLVLTVDTPVLGRRLADTRNGFSLPPPLKFANFEKAENAEMPDGKAGKSGFMQYVSAQIDPTLDWNVLHWIRTITKLPVVVKGIMTAEDATFSLAQQVSGIIVSNHGGRQMDGAPATVWAATRPPTTLHSYRSKYCQKWSVLFRGESPSSSMVGFGLEETCFVPLHWVQPAYFLAGPFYGVSQ